MLSVLKSAHKLFHEFRRHQPPTLEQIAAFKDAAEKTAVLRCALLMLAFSGRPEAVRLLDPETQFRRSSRTAGLQSSWPASNEEVPPDATGARGAAPRHCDLRSDRVGEEAVDECWRDVHSKSRASLHGDGTPQARRAGRATRTASRRQLISTVSCSRLPAVARRS